MDTVSSDGSRDIARCILDLVFNGQAMSLTLKVEQLSHEQRLGLEAIANSKQFWSGFSATSNTFYILKPFGLLIRPEKLQAFLAGELMLPDADEGFSF